MSSNALNCVSWKLVRRICHIRCEKTAWKLQQCNHTFQLIVTHIQLLIGLGVYIIGNWYGFLSDMKNSATRLLALEHPLIMIIAIVLITMGWSKHKKQVKSESKFKSFTIFYGLALVLILSRIHWSNWFV